MIKIGFFTDLHLRGQNFSSRKDDYQEAVIKKLSFCLQRCSKECNIILFGGDFTDSYRLTSDDIKEKAIMTMFKDMGGLPFFYTLGQHDLQGQEYANRVSVTTSMIMRLVRLLGKDVNELPVEEPVVVDVNGYKIALAACPSGFDHREWSKTTALKMMNVSAHVRIAVFHHLISTDNAPWLTPVDDITTSVNGCRCFDVVLCGDLHDGFGPFTKSDGCLMVNPGSLARTKKTKKDYDRDIMGVDVVVDNDGQRVTCRLETWKVSVASSACDVFKEHQPFVESTNVVFEKEALNNSCNFDEVIDRLSSLRKKRVDFWDLLLQKAQETQLDEVLRSYIMSKRRNA